MKAFRRMYKYIAPQWPRIVVVISGAFMVSLLLSLSFITIIPLLKVMMGEEGLHGWVDRKTCNWRYGMDFYVPDATDLTDKNSRNVTHALVVTKVKRDGLAYAAGIRLNDRILGAGKLQIGSESKDYPAAQLLQELAITPEQQLIVQLAQTDSNNVPKQIVMQTNITKEAQNSAKWKTIKRIQWDIQRIFYAKTQHLMVYVPRDNSAEAKTKAITFVMLFVLVVTIIRCIAKYLQDYLAQKVVHTAINNLRRDAFEHVTKMPVKYFVREQASDTVSRLIRDSGAMGNGIKTLLGKALREPLNAAFFLGTAMYINWQLTLVFLTGAPATLWVTGLLGKRMKKATKKSLVSWSQMLAKLHDTVAGLRVVKVYNQSKNETYQFNLINLKLLKQMLRSAKIDAATMPLLEAIGMAAGAVAIIFGTTWINKGRLDAPSFFTILILLGSAAEAVRKTSDIWNKIQESNAAAERVFSLVDQPIEYEKPNAIELKPLKNKIEFKNIVFTYPGSERPVLNNINLTVNAGQTIAIVGSNGSGKTTLANLLPRFYDADSGQILIDGQDTKDVTLFSLRDKIGMVTQNVVTFSGSIAANIAYANPDASRDEIVKAAKSAFADEFIAPLPNGYDTLIGEQGTGLSGGQLQRIIIARAILKNPAILIFDEATSQIDADSESKIHKAIEMIMHNRTCFIIAHRFSTILNADIIVVMDRGKIIAKGTHAELVKSCGLYKNLYETQLIA